MAPNAVRRFQSLALLPVRPGFGQNIARDDAGSHDILLVVYVIDETIERFDALLQTRLDHMPFIRFHDARNDVEWKDLFGSLAITINSKGDSHTKQCAVDGSLSLLQFAGRQFVDTVDQDSR